MAKTGAALLMSDAGPVWCHYSQKGDTLKLRRYADGMAYDVNGTKEEVIEFVPLSTCQSLIQQSGLSFGFGNDKFWLSVFQKLEASDFTSVKKRSPSQLIVPITPLRRYYEMMKFLDKTTWVELAKFYNETPDSLIRLWNNSRKEFGAYNNPDGWGIGKRKELPNPLKLEEVGTTNEFTAHLELANDSFGFLANGGYKYVEREINPWRTRKAIYSDKRSARNSGAGGMDLLLESKAGNPVVAEVKVKDDKNAFYALIQGMTYAVELSTPNQIRRLKSSFDGSYDKCEPEHGEIEIALILVNPVSDESRESVRKLIEKLNKNRSKKCPGLGQIVLWRNTKGKWEKYA